ncbi:MAG: type III-B CRISPR module-associated protein Cmr5 [Polyangiaceae bacterium]|nr:type III-B CRISPR module-associated protein Cmr5 [Polyangiaceae bacterium]
MQEAADLGGRASARYGTLARKLPSYLQVSGVGQTLAFLFGRSGGDQRAPEGLLLKHLGEHLKKELRRPPEEAPMDTVLGMTLSQYRQATRELMELAGWLKRFAEGRLGQEDG